MRIRLGEKKSFLQGLFQWAVSREWLPAMLPLRGPARLLRDRENLGTARDSALEGNRVPMV